MAPRDIAARLLVVVAAAATVATSDAYEECSGDADCAQPCAQSVSLFLDEQAAAEPPQPTVVRTRQCQVYASEQAGHVVSERQHCACSFNGGRTQDVWGDDDFCLVVSRNSGCLLNATELPLDVCDLDGADSCSAACDLLAARITEDEARFIDKSLLAATCADDSTCDCLVQIDDACFTQRAARPAPDGPDDAVPCP